MRFFRYAFALIVLWTATFSSSLFALEKTPNCDSNPPHYFSIFTREDCVNCIRLKTFLDANFASGAHRVPKYYDLADPKNQEAFDAFTTRFKLTKTTPIILIGDTIIQGYAGEETTGKLIKNLTDSLYRDSFFENASDDCKVESSASAFACSTESDAPICVAPAPSQMLVKVPFFGLVNLKEYSLPVLSAVLGFVDGFNPCAMWVLVMFLTILLQTGSRRKMMEVMGIFILAETIMYYGILNAWFSAWNFIKLDGVVTPLVGLVSLWAGAYFIYEFFTNKDGECKVTSFEEKKRLSERIKEIVSKPMTIGMFFATIALAFSVNIIEFACSIGIPQTFTKLLDMSSISLIAKQGYILLYTLFYMIDDFIVFGVALWGFKYLHLTTKYTRYCLAIWGSVMIILGYLFLFHPLFLKMLIA